MSSRPELLYSVKKLCGRPPQYAPRPCKLTFDLLTLKVVFESHVTWATSVPILVFLALSGLDLGPMHATDRQTSDAHHRLMSLSYGRDIINDIKFTTRT